jgi:lactate permease
VSLPVNLLTWVGAALPIALLLYLLVWRHWSAVQAAVAGVVTALLVGLVLYRSPPAVLGVEVAKGVWNSVSIMAVILPAILIYEVSHEVGGFSAIQRDLTRLIPDKLLQVLALGWCLASFLQGPSGFGVPIAVTAPLLIGIGVRPFWAVLVPLMAHAWANTFGTLALAWEALVQQTSLASNPAAYWQAAWWTGILTGLLCLLAGAIICWQYRGLAGLRRGWPAVLTLGGIQAGGQLFLSQITPTLSALIPATLALGAVFALARMPFYAQKETGSRSPMLEDKDTLAQAPTSLTLHEALLPYYILVGISVAVLLTPPITTTLALWKMSFSFPETVTGYGFVNKAHAAYGPVAWLTHSGFFLLLAALLSGAYFSAKGLIHEGGLARIVGNTLKKSVPAAVSVAFLLAMSKVMSGSGQVDILARGTAAATGDYYAFLAPLVGTLGAFMSSSNVSSNILFGSFQESMAQLTGNSAVVILAAQTSGAAIGTMFSPSKVLLGTTTAGIIGQEGAIIRKLLGVALAAAAMMGVITYAFSR